MTRILCVDVGSTFTKGALVEVPSGRLLATASHPTTINTDVLEGLSAVRTAAEQSAGVVADEVRVCSSAGGGLRLAVVGYERLVTAEAGARVGLSAGARVVQVSSGALDKAGLTALRKAKPDVVLLVGGTDGGNAEVLLHNARVLASGRAVAPVVVAGNAAVTGEVCSILEAGGRTALPTANVLPRIGVLDPTPARAAIREIFISHVIGGKGLSKGEEFRSLVRAATPDAVLAGVELLADGAGDVSGAGDVLVVDVGGATTDVYSVVTPDPEEAALHREVVEVMWRERTVEGDLGVRWNAPGVVDAAVQEQLIEDQQGLRAAADLRAADPAFLAESDAELAVDVTLTRCAVTVALRRHARAQVTDESGARRPGKDLREVALVVGSGGVLRHASKTHATEILRPALADHAGGWLLPEAAAVVIDRSYVLAAAGLLSADHPTAGARMLRGALVDRSD